MTPGSKDERRAGVLAKSDLLMARDEILDMHRMANKEAAREGGEYVYKVEYVAAWQAFRNNPTVDTARAFLEIAPSMIEYFEMCSPGHSFYSTNRYLKERGLGRREI
jgi:hypothetical protein